MKKIISLLVILLCTGNICFSKSKSRLFANSQYSDRMEAAKRLNDSGMYYEAYNYLLQLKQDADSIIKDAHLTAASLPDNDDFKFYNNILSSVSECAYAAGLHKDIITSRSEQLKLINKRLNLNLGRWADYRYQIGAYYKSLADEYVMDNSDNFYLTARKHYKEAMHQWSLGGFVEDSLGINIDLAQLEYIYKDYESAKEYLEAAISGMSRRYAGNNDEKNYSEEQRNKLLRTLKSALAMTEAHLGNFDTAQKIIEAVIKEAGSKSSDITELKRRKAKISMLHYLDNGSYDPKISQAYEAYFKAIKDTVNNQFLKMPNRQREQYWMGQRGFVTDCYQLEDKDPELLYNVTLYNKGILLETCHSFENLLTKDEKDHLSELRKKDSDNIVKGGNSKEGEKYEQELLTLIRKDGRAKSLLKELDYTWKDVQKVLPADGCAMEIVEYEKNNENYYGAIIVKSKGKPIFLPLYKASEIYSFQPYNIKGNLGDLLRSDSPEALDYIYADKHLNRLVWGDIAKEVSDCKKIYYAPDGLFHRLAMEFILPESMKDKKVYRLTSTRVLVQGNRPSPERLRSCPMLVIGGVTYESDSISNIVMPKNNDVNAYLELHKNATNMHIPASPLHVLECDSIITNRHNPKDLHLQGLKATEIAFYEKAPQYSLIHLCTHGGFDAKLPATSDILASGSSDILSKSMVLLSNCVTNLKSDHFDSTNKDGILTAREVADMDLSNVELFTASACVTGYGYITADGVYSMERGFKSAGVKGLVMSLCSIYQQVGRVFFNLFYKNLHNGDSIYEAFYNAREQMQSMQLYDLGDNGEGSEMRYVLQKWNLAAPSCTNSLMLIDVWD